MPDPRPTYRDSNPKTGPSHGPSTGPSTARSHAPENPPPESVDAARSLAIRSISKQARLFPELSITELRSEALPTRDAAFAHAIYDAVLRRWLTLQHLTSLFLIKNGKLDAPVQACLLAGAAQLVLLDKVPAHAAIHETVEILKSSPAAKGAGLVNAVLRRISEFCPQSTPPRPNWTNQRDEVPLPSGGARSLLRPAFGERPLMRAAEACGLGPETLQIWSDAWGEDAAINLAHHTVCQAPTVLHVPIGVSLPETTPHTQAGAAVWNGSRAALSTLMSSRSDVWVQDAASQRVIRTGRAALEKTEIRRIVDLCAGQGTKTRALRAAWPNAKILATDTDEERRLTLAATFRNDPAVRVLGSHEVEAESGGRADLVLLDVPCTNSGVLARRAEARYRLGHEQVQRLVPLQRSIIARGAALTRPGGYVLYATCSIDREENEDQMAWAATELGLVPVSHERTMPAGLPGEPASRYLDGSFWVLFRTPDRHV